MEYEKDMDRMGNEKWPAFSRFHKYEIEVRQLMVRINILQLPKRLQRKFPFYSTASEKSRRNNNLRFLCCESKTMTLRCQHTKYKKRKTAMPHKLESKKLYVVVQLNYKLPVPAYIVHNACEPIAKISEKSTSAHRQQLHIGIEIKIQCFRTLYAHTHTHKQRSLHWE